MATDEERPAVAANDVFGDWPVAPLPAGTAMEAAFLLVKLDNGDWSARQIGESYNRSEFLGQLSAYVHALLQDEALDWQQAAPPVLDDSGSATV